ncbi:MAG: carbon storage regulator CsrA [Myxococcota bacterium]|nr:carbon storage regulator CsrA [Myxococcota bacterium]
MLTLTRKVGESVRIGDDITVVVKEIKGRQIRLGIIAPRHVYVCREELYLKIQEANQEAKESNLMTLDSARSLLGALNAHLGSAARDHHED